MNKLKQLRVNVGARRPLVDEAESQLISASPPPIHSRNALRRVIAGRAAPLPEAMLQLQRLVGNRAVQKLVARRTESPAGAHVSRPPIQAKLVVGPAHDAFEQEADRVAAEVAGGISYSERASPGIQRREDQALQRSATAVDGLEVSPELEKSIQAARSGGQPLAEPLQTSMGRALDADFSGVRVHTNSEADMLNRSVQARAFTTGQDIFFRKGEYNPDSQAGQQLLVHELTHVVQQREPAARSKSEAAGDQGILQRWPDTLEDLLWGIIVVVVLLFLLYLWKQRHPAQEQDVLESVAEDETVLRLAQTAYVENDADQTKTVEDLASDTGLRRRVMAAATDNGSHDQPTSSSSSSSSSLYLPASPSSLSTSSLGLQDPLASQPQPHSQIQIQVPPAASPSASPLPSSMASASATATTTSDPSPEVAEWQAEMERRNRKLATSLFSGYSSSFSSSSASAAAASSSSSSSSANLAGQQLARDYSLSDQLSGSEINKFKDKLMAAYYPEGKSKAHPKHGSSKQAQYSVESQLGDFLSIIPSMHQRRVAAAINADFGTML